MAWVKVIEPGDATGRLKHIYQAAQQRAGYVPHVTKLQSLRPDTLQSGLALYRQLMDAPTGLTVRQRVLIATVVSHVNGCHY